MSAYKWIDRLKHALPLERALELYLLLLVASMLAMGLPATYGDYSEIVFTFVVSFTLLVGFVIVAESRASLAGAVILAGGALLARWGGHFFGWAWLHLLDGASSLGFLALLISVLAHKVLDRSRVTRAKIEGAVVMYALLALFWGRIYAMLEMMLPGSFNFPHAPERLLDLYRQATYFSFMTFTTVGYGDITPAQPLTEALAMLQACVGVLFPNILIARLVSLEIIHSGAAK